MAATNTIIGLLRKLQQAYESTNYNAARNYQVLSIDDSSNALVITDDQLNEGGAVSNQYDQAFDATPTETTDSTSATVTTVTTIPVGSGNFVIRRITFHDNTIGNVSTSSTTLMGGIDGQSLTKTSDFTLEFTLRDTLTDNS